MRNAPAAEKIAEMMLLWGQQVIDNDKRARQELSEAALGGRLIDCFTIAPVLRAQAEANLWADVLSQVNDGANVLDAVRDVRAQVTNRLLTRGESRSTDGITNEATHLEREAAQNFLRATTAAA